MRLCATIRARRSLVKPWQSHLSIYATGGGLEFHAFHPTRGARHQFAVRAPAAEAATISLSLRVGIDSCHQGALRCVFRPRTTSEHHHNNCLRRDGARHTPHFDTAI